MTEGFHKVITCSVLAENCNKVFGRIDPKIKDASFLTVINHVGETADTILAPLNIYSCKLDKLCKDFQVVDPLRPRLGEILENSAHTYICLFGNNFVRLPYEGWLKQLHDLGKTAEKLQSQIPKGDANFYEMLSYFDHFEDESSEITPKDFFNDVIHKLELIKALRYNVVNSKLGKFYGLNVASRKKNHALNTWIALMCNFWMEELGRDLNRDKTGIGGRKRFLEFMGACIEPLHPEILSDIGEPLGRLDTALKSVQKEIKLRVENKAQK